MSVIVGAVVRFECTNRNDWDSVTSLTPVSSNLLKKCFMKTASTNIDCTHRIHVLFDSSKCKTPDEVPFLEREAEFTLTLIFTVEITDLEYCIGYPKD
uniref:Uncharacterized protein n=1 Tax=Romanomermis culicivorax TaxID=13658 RepID=A0A915KU03_ROMCU